MASNAVLDDPEDDQEIHENVQVQDEIQEENRDLESLYNEYWKSLLMLRKEFLKCRSVGEVLDFMSNEEFVQPFAPNVQNPEIKDIRKAHNLKELGDMEIANGDTKQAILFYNKAIMHIPVKKCK